MASSFPGAIDSFTTKVDGIDDVMAAHVNDLQDSVVAIETMLDQMKWQDWTPAFSTNGSMTFTSITTDEARYSVIGKLLSYKIRFYGTIGGTLSSEIYFTVPIERKDQIEFGSAGVGFIYDSGDKGAIVTFISNAKTTIRVKKYDGANYLGGLAVFIISGFYEIA